MQTPFDEMNLAAGGQRPHYDRYAGWLGAQPEQLMRERREQAS